ncbi:MAG: 16S rRNA (cytidine(1402)-2'-O)-methyltransferase [Longimicrobiales bacterium]
MARLFIVSTPIGNLGDMTYRGVEVLRGVARILAEDTRRTSILLRHYAIETPLVSLHEHNEAARSEQVCAWLDAGEDLALVADAGTPLVSDPGERLVGAVFDAGHEVVPVPGASAVLAALVGSGLPAQPFTFVGFLARKAAERRRQIETLAGSAHTAVLFESPNRLHKLLLELTQTLEVTRPVVVVRELTKLHETWFRGTLADALAYYDGRPVRGEVVVLVGGAMPAAPAAQEEGPALAAALVADGLKPSAVARQLSARLGVPRAVAYELALDAARAQQ